MATALVSLDEYLHTSYRPDCDYVDGAVLERNLGQYEHARLQGLLIAELMRHEREWRIHVLPEQRVKIRSHKYRVPDVLVIAEDAPRPKIIEEPPVLCIEIVSPDDKLADLTDRANDYLVLGVPETWILDPIQKRIYVYSSTGLHEMPLDAELAVSVGKARVQLAPALLFVQV